MLADKVGQKVADAMLALVQSSPIPSVLVDKNVNVMKANLSALKFFSQGENEIFGHPLGEMARCMNRHENIQGCGHGRLCIHCIIRTSAYEVIATRQTAGNRETDMVLEIPPDGHHQLFRVRFNMSPAEFDGVPYVFFQIIDATSLKMDAERRLSQIEWLQTYYRKFAFFRLPADLPAEEQKALNPTLPARGMIFTSLGESVLEGIALEHLESVGICFAIIEADGELAFSLFDKGWMRFYLYVVRNRLSAHRNTPVVDKDAWLVLRRVLRRAVCRSREQGKPVDLLFTEGLRIFLHPVWIRNNFGGALMFVYADRTVDSDDIVSLSMRFNYPYSRLKDESNPGACEIRSPEEIANAKARLSISALLAGTLLETHQAEEERDRMELQLQQSQKMEAIGRLASGVAHDFNNVLQAVFGYAELLRDGLPKNSEFASYAEEIISISKRAASLSHQLLTFARQQTGCMEVFDLRAVVAEAMKIMKRLIGEIVLEWMPCEEPCFVKMDPVQLDQILVNLAVNARDAIGTKKDGKITILAKVVEGDALASVPGLSHTRHTLLSVMDNGCGMTQALVQHIFEPFFTTKEKSKGTGLGLANVYGIVRQAGGVITVDSQPGQGSRFCIYLPEQKPEKGAKVEIAQPPEDHFTSTDGKRETILLVDDETSLLRSVYRTLVSLNYNVLACASGDSALGFVKDYKDKIDVLVTDVVMPGMSGRELWQQALKIRPDLKCVFISGFPGNIFALRSFGTEKVSFLRKPFSEEDLSKTLRQILSREEK